MSDIQFEEPGSDLYTFQSRSVLSESATPRMVQWLMKMGIIRSEKVGGLVLIGVIVVAFGVSIFFFFF